MRPGGLRQVRGDDAGMRVATSDSTDGQHLANLLDRATSAIEVNDCMAVGADRYEVSDWVYSVRFSDGRKRPKVVNVDVSFGRRPVRSPKAESTDKTSPTVLLYTFRSGFFVAFVSIHRNSTTGSFKIVRWIYHLLRHETVRNNRQFGEVGNSRVIPQSIHDHLSAAIILQP